MTDEELAQFRVAAHLVALEKICLRLLVASVDSEAKATPQQISSRVKKFLEDSSREAESALLSQSANEAASVMRAYEVHSIYEGMKREVDLLT